MALTPNTGGKKLHLYTVDSSTAHNNNKSCVQLPTSANNMALPALLVCTVLSAGQQLINISCPLDPQQQTHCTLLLQANGTDRRKDTVPLHRPCSVHYTNTTIMPLRTGNKGGSVAEWLACWTQAQKGLDTNRSRDAVG